MTGTPSQDLRYAIRALRSSPGFSAVAILSLALGIGANTAIFSLIDAVMLRSLPVSHPQELLRVTMAAMGGSFTNPQWEQLRDRQDVLSGVFAYGGTRFNLSRGGESRMTTGNWVSGDYFSTLGVGSLLGRTLTRADDRRGCPGVAVLNYDFWRREYAGNPDVLDKTISLDGHPFQIVGVVQPGFSGVDVGRPLDVIVPLCSEAITRGQNSALDRPSIWWLNVIGRPKSGMSPLQVAARLKTLAPDVMKVTLPPRWRAEDQQSYLRRTFDTQPAANGLSFLRRQYRPALIALMVMVGVVLLIACANVANLLLARATVRRREVAIRLALGCGRGRLIRQLLTESLLLSLAGAALGILFAKWGGQLLVGFLSSSGNQVFLDLAIDARVLAFTVAVALATGVLFGLAPAWRSTQVQPHVAMKANARGIAEGHTRFSLVKALVLAQVALSLVLVVGAGLMLGTLRTLATLDPGFQRDHVLLVTADLRPGKYPPARLPSVYREMLDRLRVIPSVRSASSSNLTPIGNSSWNDEIIVDGYTAKSRDDATVYFNQVSPGYFETLGTPLVTGRDFNEHDSPGSAKVAMINETMARKFFASVNPLGRHLRVQNGKTIGPPLEIVGVVKDAKYRSLREEILPTAYLPMSQDSEPDVFVNFELQASGPAAALIPGVKEAIGQVNRDVTLGFVTLATQVGESLNRERLLATLSGFFGGLALLLAAIGLYGVMSYNVSRRRSEIGIRMALGAGQSTVLRMVLGEVALLAGAGLIVGLGAALAATRLMSTFLYGLKATDPATLLLAAAVLAAVAALAGYLPARRASRLDPMVALREE
jgi:putative ABC transport system permease protein